MANQIKGISLRRTTVAFAIAVHYLIGNFMDQEPNITSTMTIYLQKKAQVDALTQTDSSSPEYQALVAETDAYYQEIYPDVLTFYYLVMNITYVAFCILFFAFQHIPEIVYTSMLKRQYNPYAFKNILDFVIFCLFFTFILITYGGNLNGTWKEKGWEQTEFRATTYSTNFTNGYPQREIWLLIFCSTSMWVRVVYLMRYNEYLGRITGILDKIAHDMLIYFSFFLVEVLFFALLAEQAFRQLDDYNTLVRSFRTLFYATFGQFDFGGFEDAYFTKYFGITFLIIFLVINLGLFMSLFISMLVTLYEAFVEKQTVYHMLETLKIRPQTMADKDYSALISIPPPLNVFLIFLGPALLTSSNPEFWNRVTLWVAFNTKNI